jgi:hypothetical protein
MVVDREAGDLPESLLGETPEVIFGHYWIFHLP